MSLTLLPIFIEMYGVLRGQTSILSKCDLAKLPSQRIKTRHYQISPFFVNGGETTQPWSQSYKKLSVKLDSMIEFDQSK